ncbi:hypothetical protein QTI66_29020 [Variovorax sp. J22R133]|uniref:hypothetical protein n=1 Tax=Variovorax brevis TaxID=3053503 RepID=UPI0025790829|nr:hypothetical protein [Variovorax sp. J22R133]MDM0116213.1 hypothetical protein [Variovorax sp. J22R133]
MPVPLIMNLRVLFAVAALTQIVGCASIVSGSNQTISVETKSDSDSVAGATCKLTNNKGTWYVTTPGSTTVHRSFDDLGVTCTKQDYAQGAVAVKSSTKAMAFGNILFGGVIGVGVDVATGAAYDYPTVVSVALGRALAASNQPPSNASVEMAAVHKSGPSTTSALERASAPKATGADTYNAERIAKSQACTTPSASMVEKGAGFEAYRVACGGGEVLAIRCEFGNCRILR